MEILEMLRNIKSKYVRERYKLEKIKEMWKEIECRRLEFWKLLMFGIF